jgi:hypothetical protein
MDLIQRAVITEEKHAIIWCINNLVALRDNASIKPLYYEHLYGNTDELARQIASRLPASFGAIRAKSSDRPSRTTTSYSPVIKGQNNLVHWKTALPAPAVRRILDVVSEFGLDFYDESPLPRLRETDGTTMTQPA